MHITTVPQELVEHILVLAARDGYPRAVSALSQTCRHFHGFLGLKSGNRHLWRDLFLAVFEDPTGVVMKVWRRQKEGKEEGVEKEYPDRKEGRFNWQQEFLDRIQVERFFARWTSEASSVQDPHLLEETLRTLVKAITTDNAPMKLSFSTSTSLPSAVDDSADNPFLLGTPLSNTHLVYPLMIVLHALSSQRDPTSPSRLHPSHAPAPGGEQAQAQARDLSEEETWGIQLFESVRSSTSAWAEERVLANGYPTVLKERLMSFDAWMHRRSKSRARADRARIRAAQKAGTLPGTAGSGGFENEIATTTRVQIVQDPEWELTESGRLFYKLVFMKGYLWSKNTAKTIGAGTKEAKEKARKKEKMEKTAARILARRRVYDMRYLNQERLWGPFLPIGVKAASIEEGPEDHVQNDGNEDVGGEEGEEDEEDEPDATSQLHLDMIQLLTAGIHPHLLIHHHLFQNGLLEGDGGATVAGAGGGDTGDGVPPPPPVSDEDEGEDALPALETPPESIAAQTQTGVQNQTGSQDEGDPTNPLQIAMKYPYIVYPDYPFLSAARLLVEMNMKAAWGNLFPTGDHDDGDDDEEDEDEDEDEFTFDEIWGGHSTPDPDVHIEEPAAELEEDDSDFIPNSEPSSSSTTTGSSMPSLESISGLETADSVSSSQISDGNENGGDDGDDTNTANVGNAGNAGNSRGDRRLLVEKLVDAFSGLDFVRMGGAAGYWKVKAETKNDGKRRYPGWDWAGVEGEWRRVVCWMDYQDLLLHSSGATGLNPSFEIDEAVRQFPIKLHITGYEPPPEFPSSNTATTSASSSATYSENMMAPEYGDELTNPDAPIWHLPVIHFAGESGMPEHAGPSAQGAAGNGMVRMVSGSVRMIGDGAVWWSMTLNQIGQTDLGPEWSMEGIQVGCIGSAAGIIGMWTGAEHNRGDPIGPCWQWKVA